MVETRIYNKYQTIIPKEIRRKFEIKIDDTIKWEIKNKKIVLTVKKQKSLDEIEKYSI